jgi:hypothetical protein
MVERNIKDQDSHEINILAIISMVIWGGCGEIIPQAHF